jgi:hypothetical protein
VETKQEADVAEEREKKKAKKELKVVKAEVTEQAVKVKTEEKVKGVRGRPSKQVVFDPTKFVMPKREGAGRKTLFEIEHEKLLKSKWEADIAAKAAVGAI